MAIAAVRAAAVHDVDEIVRIQADTWAAAYAELVPPAAIDAARRGPGPRQAWASAVVAGDGYHVLRRDRGRVDGRVLRRGRGGGPGRGGPRRTRALGPEAWAEVGALLVEPRWGRRGHGGRLLAAAADALRAGGALYGLAWVPEADEASRRFYARAGWEPDGAVRVLDTGDGELREVRVTGSLDLQLQE